MGAFLTTTVDGDTSETFCIMHIRKNNFLFGELIDQPLITQILVELVDTSDGPDEGQELYDYYDSLPGIDIDTSRIQPGRGWIMDTDTRRLIFMPDGTEQWIFGEDVHICTVNMQGLNSNYKLAIKQYMADGNIYSHNNFGEDRLVATETDDVPVFDLPRAVTIHSSSTVLAPFRVYNLPQFVIMGSLSEGSPSDAMLYNYTEGANGQFSYSEEVSPSITISDNHLMLTEPLPPGVYLLIINILSEDVGYSTSLTMRITSTADMPTFDTIAANAESDHIAMDNRMTLSDEIFDRRSIVYTHVRIYASDAFSMTLDDEPTTDDRLIVPRDSVQMLEIALQPRARGRAAPVAIDYDLSVDNGGSFTILGRMNVRSVISCFDLEARVQLWAASPTWCRIVDLEPGARIMTLQGEPETVVSVKRTEAADIDLIHVPTGSLGRGIPTRDICITPSHYVILNGMVRMRAERLVHQSARITRIRAHAAVCHVQTREPCFMIVDGIVAESWVGPTEQHARLR